MNEQVLRDVDALDTALAQPRVLLFKHSPICPISATARAEYKLFQLDHPDAPTVFVDVVASQPLARAVAERSGVRHESPQAILFEAGEATWDASHSAITSAALAAAWAPRC
ncbi:MAG: bacillithiol system redox-active protein YtxJ [Planctomycetota bacterium]|nr:bacillithiol system redox-active protein YtxJ [Planctomycetota bacterium]